MSAFRALSGENTGSIETNKVLRSTYSLLAMTVLFSALISGLTMVFNFPHPGIILTLLGYFGLLYLTHIYSNSAKGLVAIFALTGFMGYTLGPILNAVAFLNGGTEIITLAFASTGIIFLSLSGYILTTGKNFNFLGSFLFTGILVGFILALTAYFFSMPALSLTVSAVFVLLMSGLILYQTSEIIHGGETNYILATVTLYVSLYNLFTSLIHLLSFFHSNE